MAITLSGTGDRWSAEATRPEADNLHIGPASLHELVQALVAGGCHPVDVSDAVFAADRAAWVELFDPNRKFERYYRDIN